MVPRNPPRDAITLFLEWITLVPTPFKGGGVLAAAHTQTFLYFTVTFHY